MSLCHICYMVQVNYESTDKICTDESFFQASLKLKTLKKYTALFYLCNKFSFDVVTLCAYISKAYSPI